MIRWKSGKRGYGSAQPRLAEHSLDAPIHFSAPREVAGRLLAAIDWHCAALFLLPLLVLSAQSDPIFPRPGAIDTWVYLGFFRNFFNFKHDLFRETYYGSRLSWLLPGFAVHHFFSPVLAAYVLHLLTYFAAVLSLYYTVSRTIGRRTGMLAAVTFGLYPYLWQAVGWDYGDGAGIAYYLLTTALLTKASLTGGSRGSLFGAGVAFAALVYSNLVWVMLSPVLAAHYLGMRRPSGARAWKNAIVEAAVWVAMGATIVTVCLGVVNYLTDSNFWFYAPTLRFALQFIKEKNPWYKEPYSAGLLLPHLWMPAFTLCLTSISYGWTVCRRQKRSVGAGAVYFIELAIASALWIYSQFRGNPLLGIPFYASYLIPSVFLAGASLYWEGAERLTRRGFAMALAGAAAGCSFTWWIQQMSPLFGWSRPQNHVALVAAALLLAGAMLLRRPGVAVGLSIAGLAVLYTSAGFGRPADGDSNRRAYERVLDGRSVVEEFRGRKRIRWWYSEKDPEPGRGEIRAMSSSYLWQYALIGQNFPELPRNTVYGAPSMVAVASYRPDTPELARRQLAEVLRPQGRVPTLKSSRVIEDRDTRYTVALIEITNDMQTLQPLAATFEGGSPVSKLLPAGQARAYPIPAEHWELCQYADAREAGIMTRSGDGVRVRTPKKSQSFAMTYPVLTAPAAGRYRIVLQYELEQGNLAFGAMTADQSAWLTNTVETFPDESGNVMAVDARLTQGQAFRILIANNMPVDKSSVFVIKETAIFRVPDNE